MTNRELKTQLRRSLTAPDISPAPQALAAAGQLAGLEAARRAGRRRIGFWELARMQVCFLGWKLWAAQGLFLLAVWLLFPKAFFAAELRRPQAAAQWLVGLSVLTSMAAPPLLYRSIRFRMQETESAAYFSASRLLAARLLIIGIGDAALLACFVLLAAVNTALHIGSAAVAVALPFLLTGCGGLYLLGHASPRQFLWGSLGQCGLLLLALESRRLRWLLSPGPLTASVCAALLLLCVWQLRCLLYSPLYAERQIA